MMTDELLTTMAAAEHLGCSDAHIRKLVLAGRLVPAQRYPRLLLFTRAELDRYASGKSAAGWPIGRPRKSA